MTATENIELFKQGIPQNVKSSAPSWRKRSCTDVPCLIIFAIFLAGWAGLAKYAIDHGRLDRLTLPVDSQNQRCGIDSGVLHKNNLFYFDITKCLDPLSTLIGCSTTTVCVKECPTSNFDWSLDAKKYASKNFADLKKLLICKSDDILENISSLNDIETAIEREDCAKKYQKSTATLNQCIFDLSTADCVDEKCKEIDLAVVKEKIEQTGSQFVKIVTNLLASLSIKVDAQTFVEDFINSVPLVLSAMCLTCLTTLILIFTMRWIAAPLVWSSIVGVLLSLLFAIYVCFKQHLYWKDVPTVAMHGFNLKSQYYNIIQDAQNWLYLTISLCMTLLVLLIFLLFLRSRIRVAVALTIEASKAVSSVYSTVFFPLFTWLLILGAIAYAMAVGLHLLSIGRMSYRWVPKMKNENDYYTFEEEHCVCEAAASNFQQGGYCEPALFEQYCYNAATFNETSKKVPCTRSRCAFDELQPHTYIKWLFAFNLFGYLWLYYFIEAFNAMVLAGTFANWYWCRSKKDVPFFTLTKSLLQTICYHLGTIAFGALLVAICRFIRIMLEYAQKKLKLYDNVVTRAIVWCLRCLFWLLEKFLKFISYNAFIMCAIHGRNFCVSAKDAFTLIFKNCLRFAAVNVVTDFLFFLAKVFLTAAAAALTYFYASTKLSGVIHYAAVPALIVSCGAILMTSVFFDVYSLAVDTLFLCCLEDLKRNDGTAEKPYYMSKQLRRIFGKQNFGA